MLLNSDIGSNSSPGKISGASKPGSGKNSVGSKNNESPSKTDDKSSTGTHSLQS